MSQLHVKKYIPVLHGSCTITKYMASAFTFEIDAAGSWRLGGIVVLVFFCILCVVGCMSAI
jgi:hypothetical protein